MVKILVCEDNPGKLSHIVSFIEGLNHPGLDILIAEDMAEFTSKFSEDVDICIVDIRIPAYKGAEADQNGLGILQHLESTSTGKVKLLAISAYPDEFDGIRERFERQGCVLANYNLPDVWQNALRMLILQSSSQVKFDFLIFVALPKERAPYLARPELQGKVTTSDGLTRYDITLNGKAGSVIELPRMGLVDASITAAKCIDRYSPTIIAMSGICAGFAERSELGQLLISETAYEYQTGKWTNDGFEGEPYQHSMSEKLRTIVRNIIDDSSIVIDLEEGWPSTRPGETHSPKLAVFTSGSAVIADEKYIAQVASRHRKVSGLDMEVFGIHRAAHLSSKTPDVLCAKVVVDLGDQGKNDKIQPYGCYISSRFLLKSLARYFE